MNNILVIESSHNREATGSRYISSKIQACLLRKYPDAKIMVRDLTKEQVPHLSETMLSAFFTPADSRSPEQADAVATSDQLTDELLAADLVIVSAPLWNFGVPSSIKAWIDHGVRRDRTFNYTAKGIVGYATKTKAVIVASAGGIYSEGSMKAMDFVVPYLQSVFSFIGITDIQVVRVEGTSIPDLKATAVKKAEAAVEALRL